MKTTKNFLLGAIFAIFFSLAFIVSSQTKKPTLPAVRPLIQAPTKEDSLLFMLPDSTKEKIRMADLKGKKLDSIASVMEKKIAVDKKQNDALKKQGAELDAITKGSTITVDTLPRPKLDAPVLPVPETIRIATEGKRGLLERLFKKRK